MRCSMPICSQQPALTGSDDRPRMASVDRPTLGVDSYVDSRGLQ
jgi:hypothetical protein